MTGNQQNVSRLMKGWPAGRIEKPLQEERGPGRMTTATDDSSLVSRTVRGDRLAFAALVHRHLPRLLAVARRMLGNPTVAEDAAQEALLKLWTHAASYDPGKASVSTWLTRIAMNVCLDRLRKRREEFLPEDYDVAQPAMQEQGILRDQVAAKVEAALQVLPERQRQALILCHYEDLSMSEAAIVMDTTVEAIESLLGRARRSLRRQLEPEWRSLLADDAAE
jgi:RNA polymerase sigma-70 factor (ECF subfamily)